MKGNYTTHVYVDYVDGTVDAFNLGNTAMNPKNQKVTPQNTYYSQRDPQWAGKHYGMANIDLSGCVPTVLAMVLGDLKNSTVKPDTIAEYLYNQTNSFNKYFIGTSVDGITAVAKKWGLSLNVLDSLNNVKEILSTGKHVLAAVGNSQFVSDPLTHELLLQGFDNGKTYVRDPYNPSNNGWYNIDYLYRIQSQDPIDRKLGSPFITIF